MQLIFQVILVDLKAKLTLITLNQSIPILWVIQPQTYRETSFILEE